MPPPLPHLLRHFYYITIVARAAGHRYRQKVSFMIQIHVVLLGGPLRPCKIQGCEDPHSAKGFCKRHYMQWRAAGCPDNWEPPERPECRTRCKVPGCENIHCAKGFCRRHYIQWRAAGCPDNWEPPERPECRTRCKVPGYEDIHYAKGFCLRHYRQWRAGTLKGFDPPASPGCKIPRCEYIHCAKGFCRSHYIQWRAAGCPDNWIPA